MSGLAIVEHCHSSGQFHNLALSTIDSEPLARSQGCSHLSWYENKRQMSGMSDPPEQGVLI